MSPFILWLKKIKEYIALLYQQYYQHKLPFLAASISFYAMLSLLPLSLFAFSFLGYLLQSAQIQNDLLLFVEKQTPIIYGFVEDNIKSVIAGRQRIGFIGLLGLLWVSTSIFAALEYALNNVYHIEQPKHFLLHKLNAVLIILIFGFLMIISFGLSLLLTNIKSWPTQLLNIDPSLISVTYKIITFFLALGLTIAIFLLIYYLVPNRKMTFKEIIAGACLAGFIWELTKYLFIWYLENFVILERIYGSLWVLIVLLSWIFISSQILLIGALINKTFYLKEGVPVF